MNCCFNILQFLGFSGCNRHLPWIILDVSWISSFWHRGTRGSSSFGTPQPDHPSLGTSCILVRSCECKLSGTSTFLDTKFIKNLTAVWGIYTVLPCKPGIQCKIEKKHTILIARILIVSFELRGAKMIKSWPFMRKPMVFGGHIILWHTEKWLWRPNEPTWS